VVLFLGLIEGVAWGRIAWFLFHPKEGCPSWGVARAPWHEIPDAGVHFAGHHPHNRFGLKTCSRMIAFRGKVTLCIIYVLIVSSV
jgi:hypothetical protein